MSIMNKKPLKKRRSLKRKSPGVKTCTYKSLPHLEKTRRKKKYNCTQREGEQSSVNTLGHNSHPAPLLPLCGFLFWHSYQYTMFSLRASSVGNRSKEKGRVYPFQLSDRLAKKDSEGRGLLTAVSVALSEKKECSSSIAQMTASRQQL